MDRRRGEYRSHAPDVDDTSKKADQFLNSKDTEGFDDVLDTSSPEALESAKEGNPLLSKELIKHYAKRLYTGRVGNLVKVLFTEPATRQRFFELHQDRETIVNDADNLPHSAEKLSAVLATLMRDKQIRAGLIEAMNEQFAEDTEALKTELKFAMRAFEDNGAEGLEDREMGALVWDELNIGAGIHASIYASAMTIHNPSTKSLTVEATPYVSSQFRTKRMVSINSANTPHERITPSHGLRTGNLNYMGKDAPVQLPFIESRRYPTGDVFADIATANMYMSGSNMMMETRVERVIKEGDPEWSSDWPAANKVIMNDGSYVFARRVNVMTGLGEAQMPASFDEESIKTVRESIENREEGEPSGIMTYESFAAFVAADNNNHPLRPFVGKKVSMVGRGDSSATSIEFLLGLSDDTAYKDDVKNVGSVDEIQWIGQKVQTAEHYMSTLKNPRYGQIGTEMPNPADMAGAEKKKIRPIGARIEQIRPNNDERGKYRVVLKVEDPVTGGVTFQEEYTDFVVLATGYKSKAGEILGFEDDPFKNPEEAEAVRGEFEDIDAKMPVAVKVKEHEIYGLGPATLGAVMQNAEAAMTGLIPTSIAQMKATAVSIGTFGPRTEKLAEIMAERQQDEEALPSAELKAEVETFEPVFDESQRGVAFTLTEKLDSLPRADLLTEAQTKAALAQALEVLVPDKATKFRIKFKRDGIRVPGASEGVSKFSVGVEFDPPLKKEQSELILQRMGREDVCKRILSLIGKGRTNTLSVDVDFGNNGRGVLPQNMEMQRTRESVQK